MSKKTKLELVEPDPADQAAADLAALQAAADSAHVVPFMPQSLKDGLPALVRVLGRLQADVDALKGAGDGRVQS